MPKTHHKLGSGAITGFPIVHSGIHARHENHQKNQHGISGHNTHYCRTSGPQACVGPTGRFVCRLGHFSANIMSIGSSLAWLVREGLYHESCTVCLALNFGPARSVGCEVDLQSFQNRNEFMCVRGTCLSWFLSKYRYCRIVDIFAYERTVLFRLC